MYRVLPASLSSDTCARGRPDPGRDRITQIDTHEIANAADLMFVLAMAKLGQEAKITYVRDGKTFTVTTIYGNRAARTGRSARPPERLYWQRRACAALSRACE